MGTSVQERETGNADTITRIRFEEYIGMTCWLLTGLALFIILGWAMDWLLDPAQASDTFWLRLAGSASVLITALLARMKISILGIAILLYAVVLFNHFVVTLLLDYLDNGFTGGLVVYVYFFISIVIMGLPLPFNVNLVGLGAIIFSPHLWAWLFFPEFPHFFYMAMIWPGGGLCIFIQWLNNSLIVRQINYKLAIEQLSLEDPLTGLLNRRGLHRNFHQIRGRAVRNDEDISLLYFDIDHFKSVNDNHGHSAGDKILEELSVLMNKTFRSSDSLARIGGEEFACLLTNINIEQAADKGERFRRAVENHEIKLSDKDGEICIKITISIGVAQFTTDDRLDDLMKRADEALYKAKIGGRNRLVRAE